MSMGNLRNQKSARLLAKAIFPVKAVHLAVVRLKWAAIVLAG